MFFCGEIKTRYTSCVRYTLCAGRPSLGAKLGLADDFLPNFSPMTPSGNGTVGRGNRDLLETGLNVGKNSSSAKSLPAKFRQKIKTTFWDMIIFHFVIFLFKNLLLNYPFLYCNIIFQ